MARYSQAASEGKAGSRIVNEFKAMVKECHRRGIEVILDVVFNHTAEGNDQGPTISFRPVLLHTTLSLLRTAMPHAGMLKLHWTFLNNYDCTALVQQEIKQGELRVTRSIS